MGSIEDGVSMIMVIREVSVWLQSTVFHLFLKMKTLGPRATHFILTNYSVTNCSIFLQLSSLKSIWLLVLVSTDINISKCLNTNLQLILWWQVPDIGDTQNNSGIYTWWSSIHDQTIFVAWSRGNNYIRHHWAIHFVKYFGFLAAMQDFYILSSIKLWTSACLNPQRMKLQLI